MKVEVLNPEVVCDLYRRHGQFACVCYDTDEKYSDRVGKSCAKDGHVSGSRCEYIKFRISDIDRGTAEQMMRHEIGTDFPLSMQDNYSFADAMDLVIDENPTHIVKNMASFRYIDKEGFTYATPSTILNCPAAKVRYDQLMRRINDDRRDIKQMLEESGVDPKRATQDVNFVLPRATTTALVVGFTPEAFIHFCNKRLCTRAQEFIREFARIAVEILRGLNEQFAKECVPQCEHLLWCPEGKRCCGRYPTRSELAEILSEKKVVSGS